MEPEIVRERPEAVTVRKRNHIWDNVFPADEIPNKENGYNQTFIDNDEVDEDEMLYVRGASPTFKSAPMRDHSPHQYPHNSHGKRPRSPGALSPSVSVKRPREEPKKKKEQDEEDPDCEAMTFKKDREKKKKKKKKMKMKKSSSREGSSAAVDIICSFYMRGKCQKGSSCTFSHQAMPLRRMEVCKYYLTGSCSRGERCLFLHQDFPCKFHHMGKRCHSGSSCKFSHAPLTDTMRNVLQRFLLLTAPDAAEKKSGSHRSRNHDRFGSNITEEEATRADSPVISYKSQGSPSNNSLLAGGDSSDGMIPSFPHFYKDTSLEAEDEQSAASSPYSSEKKMHHSRRSDSRPVESSGRRKTVDSSPESGGSSRAHQSLSEKHKQVYGGKAFQQALSEELKTETLEDDNWYSSDEEDGNVLSLKQVDPPSTSVKSNTESNVTASLNKLLSTITGRSNGEHSALSSPSRDPRRKIPVTALSSPSQASREPTPPPVINVYGSAIYNLPGGSATRDRRGGDDPESSGMLKLPFKPVPFHTPATEIYASETSHPPVEYRVAPVSIPTPDYRHLRFKSSDPQIYSDPRLRKLYKLVTSAASNSELASTVPRSDPRRRSSFRETAAVH